MNGNTHLRPISEVAADLGLDEADYETYGSSIAKLSLSLAGRNAKDGKLILVTAINPTPAGEGKTTTTIGLGQAFRRLGKKVVIAIREPSLGPCFGIKGGATGGGMATVEPSDRINLIFTGDFPAVTAAHNLLSAMINNHIHHGNKLGIDQKRIVFPRTIDMNDRSLRNIIVGVGDRETGSLNMDRFVITPASEIMAILGLSTSYGDLKERLGKIIVGYDSRSSPVFCKDLKAQGAMASLLVDALKPNLVQTQDGTPAMIHTGPFGNIAHGTSSVLADRIALKHSDYLITEAGFGSELGAEKFFDLVSRVANLPINAVVLVATIRALKHNGGVKELNAEDLKALESGFANLKRHIALIRGFGFDPVVSINRFQTDTEAEITLLEKLLRDEKARWALSEVYSKGADGGLKLAEAVLEAIGQSGGKVSRVYDLGDSLKDKIMKISRNVYGADDVVYSKEALRDLKRISKMGLDGLPVCMAKTQYSFSDDATLLNSPKGFKVHVESINISAGAGFIVPILGEIMTMPGLPEHPAAENVDVDEAGNIIGLF
ncbi:MAG: formate--tetrahydrofolate ligase [Candidatus Thermoplasmatota archaeon]|nr:formate--tetrahydrofolate ligase [Candidatus Thermoplasmatota archaeon]